MTTAVLVAVGVLGLVVGSFLNVVIARVPAGESVVRPGSHCRSCRVAIPAYHNVPIVSWIVLRGRCHRCRAPISVRYPLVEAATAGLLVAVAARIGATAALPAFLYLGAITVALAVIDAEVRRLPDAIVLPSYLVAATLLVAAGVGQADWWPAVRGFVAMAALLAGYLALAVSYPGGIGFGDVKLAGLLGLYLGWLGWNAVLIGTFAGFLLGAGAGVAMMATGRAGRRTAIAFGPYMLAGALLALFASGPIATWYISMINPTF
ncbi:MAG: prepilin peptidase [Dactylosporangium sp.]|nr:prepilin peptidase [Dactylosporangium sp.]NNJ63185.1 prepilin peptidase [Dactylosporangium sp.]